MSLQIFDFLYIGNYRRSRKEKVTPSTWETGEYQWKT